MTRATSVAIPPEASLRTSRESSRRWLSGRRARREEPIAAPPQRLARVTKAAVVDAIEFLGRVDDSTLESLYARARAAVVPNVEEFGIAAVEAQASGRPVIARAAGGVLETVVDGETGCFWSGGPTELAAAVLAFDDAAISSEACVLNASRFSRQTFRNGVFAEVQRARSQEAPTPLTHRRPLASTRLARRAGAVIPD